MSVTMLAASAVALLSPYVAKVAEGAAEELGKQGLQRGEALLCGLWARWKGKPEAEATLSTFVKDPAAGKANLQTELAVDLAADPTFRESLQTLIDGGSPEAFQNQVVRDATYVKGPEIVRLVKGRATQMQDVQGADVVIGPKIDTIGR
jgi:hypothetical protein